MKNEIITFVHTVYYESHVKRKQDSINWDPWPRNKYYDIWKNPKYDPDLIYWLEHERDPVGINGGPKCIEGVSNGIVEGP